MRALPHGILPVAAAMLFLALACAEQASDPAAPEFPALARPCASPPCGGGGGGGGDDPPSSPPTVSLSGHYTTSAPQPVTVSGGGKTLKVEGDGMTLSLALPALGALADGSCTMNGFASEADAIAFWNDMADEGGEGRQLRIQVDRKRLGSASTSHWTQVHWPGSLGYPDGSVLTMKAGNGDTFGAATYTSTGTDAYTLTGGELSAAVLGGAGNHELASVRCSLATLGGSLAFQLNR